jgi:MFS transporter, PPP family, 3-phenylpropionic acid transporter
MAVRLSLFYAAYFLFGGIQLPYWPLWLQERGLGPAEIGLVLALSNGVKVVAGPTGGWLADRWAQRRTPLILLCGLTLVGLALFVPAQGLLTIALITAFIAVTQSPIVPLGENLVLMTIRQHGLDYGRIRLWGSITFIGGAVTTGQLLTGRSPELVLWLMLAAFGLAFAATVNLPDTRPATVHGAARVSPAWLFRRPAFLLLLLTGSLTAASHAVLHGFSTLHWRANGIDSGTIGILWMLGVIAEIVLFAAGGRFANRLGVGGLFALAGLAGVVRWTVSGLTVSPWLLAPAQCLHAFTFGAAHLGAMQFIGRAIPPQVSATAQTMYSAIAIGGSHGLAIWASGGLYGALGGGAFFVMAAMSLGAMLAALLLARRWKGELLS